MERQPLEETVLHITGLSGTEEGLEVGPVSVMMDGMRALNAASLVNALGTVNIPLLLCRN